MLRLILATAALLMLACAGTPSSTPNQLQFIDSQVFDDQLHDTFSTGHAQVTVVFEGSDVTLNQIPERLDRWLHVISKRDGGKVEVLPDPAYAVGKGIGGIGGVAFGLAIGAYKMAREKVYYRPAESYDATVYYIPDQATLTRIVFTRESD